MHEATQFTHTSLACTASPQQGVGVGRWEDGASVAAWKGQTEETDILNRMPSKAERSQVERGSHPETRFSQGRGRQGSSVALWAEGEF